MAKIGPIIRHILEKVQDTLVLFTHSNSHRAYWISVGTDISDLE